MDYAIVTRLKKAALWALLPLAAAATVYGLKLRPIAVTVQPVSTGEAVAEVMGTGSLEAGRGMTVSAKIQGRITELTKDQNDSVKAGDLLARLDDAELRREVTVAQAVLEAAEATVSRLKAEEARARAVLEQARRDYERYSSLGAGKSVSQEAVEKSMERLAVGEAEIAKAVAGVYEAIRQAAASKERLKFQEARLADTLIQAPYDGLLVRRDREIGDVVVPGASIFHLISLKEMWVSAWVDESAMGALAPGQPARLVFRSEPTKEFRGKVARLGREVDRETREFKVDVKVDDLPPNWAVGQRAEAFIETGRKSGALSVPVASLVWRNGKPGVWVAADGRAARREVVLGLRGLTMAEVKEGIEKDQLIVTGPAVGQLKEGRRLQVTK